MPIELTPRDRRMLRMIEDGFTQAAIAARLRLSVRQVKRRIARLRDLMRAASPAA